MLFDNDYFVDTSSKLDVIYDFWSEGGIPVVEIVNDYQDTIFLDLNKSYFTSYDARFSFASAKQQDSVTNLSREFGYNVMFNEMPRSVLLPPDSSFVFESFPWNYTWSTDVSKKNPTKRYLYSSSPIQVNHVFMYSYKNSEIIKDSIVHRLYVSNIEQLENSEYNSYIRSIPLSNKFYIRPESGLSVEDKEDIGSTLLGLLIGAKN